MVCFCQTEKKLNEIVKEFNERLVAVASDCDETIKIRSLDYTSPFWDREKTDSPVQLKIMKAEEYAAGYLFGGDK